jgi:hypothetical protein
MVTVVASCLLVVRDRTIYALRPLEVTCVEFRRFPETPIEWAVEVGEALDNAERCPVGWRPQGVA